MGARRLAILVALGAVAGLLGCNGNGEEVGDPRVDPPDAKPAAGPSFRDGCAPTTVYRDLDGDGHGDPATAEQVCGPIPQGYVTVGNDCNDTCAHCSPLSPEVCDTLDNDCDGLVDEDLDEVPTFVDQDGDGFGRGEAIAMRCGDIPDGRTALSGDCDDGDPAAHPGAPERCNGLDDDCDGLVDEDVTEARGDPVLLGEVQSGFRQLSLAMTEGGYAVAWTEPGSRVVWARVDEGGGVLEGPSAIAPSGARQAHPVVAVAQTQAGPHLIALWTEDGRLVRARSIALGSRSRPGPVVTLSAVDDLQRLPVEPVVAGDQVVAMWLERASPARIVGVSMSPLRGGSTGAPVVLHESSMVDPDNFGPSAASLPRAKDAFFLGTVDRQLGDEVTAAYVHAIQLRPRLEPRETRVRLEPREGAVRRVVLAPSPREDVILAFLTRGLPPHEETDVYRLSPRADGATVTAELVELPARGLVLGATASEAGADVVLSGATSHAQREVRLRLCSAAGPHHDAGAVDSLLDPWAAIARPGALGGAIVYTGRLSESDVSPGIWLRRYGCE